MANLSELTSFKKHILNLVINDRECVELLTLESDIHLPAKGLLNDHIFMYNFIDETVTEAKVYLCLEVDRVRTSSIVTGDYDLYITVLCHKSLMNLDGQVRRDAVAQRIDELFNGNVDVNIGQVKLYDSRQFKLPNNSNYFARTTTYRIHGGNLGCSQF